MNRKRIISFLLIISLLCGNASPVFAAEEHFLSDYEPSVDYYTVSENDTEYNSRDTLSDNNFEKEDRDVLSETTVSEEELQDVSVNDLVKCSKLIESSEDIIRLYSSETESQSERIFEGAFSTLEEAFSEIERLAASHNYYRIELWKNQNETEVVKDLTFPSKTAGLTIIAGENLSEAVVYLNEKVVLKSHVVFEDIIFASNKDLKLELGNFSLTLAGCSSYEVQKEKIMAVNEAGERVVKAFSVNGSGTMKDSRLILKDTALRVFGNVKNIGNLVYTGEQTNVLVRTYLGKQNSRLGSVPLYSKLEADGVIEIGSIALETEGVLAGGTSVKRGNDGTILSVTPPITIGKDVSSELGKVLYLDLREKKDGISSSLNIEGADARAICREGLPMAKGVNVTYPYIQAFQLAGKNLAKKNGILTYYSQEYGVELSYIEENKEITIPCFSFSDAVAEINNRRVKRDYTISLLPANEDISLAQPKTLVMPKKNCINSLRIQTKTNAIYPKAKLYYLNKITFTCDVVLQDVFFVQMIKNGSEYKDANVVKNSYPSAVTISTGGFDLKVEGEVTFNTPIKIKGGNKGTMYLDETATINTQTNDCDENNGTGTSIIYGTITDFKTVDIKGCSLEFRAYETVYGSGKYTSLNIKSTNWNMFDSQVTIKDINAKSSFKTTNLSVEDGSLIVNGKVNLTHAKMRGTQKTIVKADKDFTITGSLTGYNDNAVLITRLKGAGKSPYLNVSGQVIREENTYPIYVGVYPELNAKDSEKPVKLSGAPKVTGQLLTAKKALATDFRPIEKNYVSGSGAYSRENPNGYMTVKSGSNIYVYEGKNVKIELLKNGNSFGFYPSVKEATTAVNAMKDKSAVYTYILTENHGTPDSPTNLTLPSQAKKITITTYPAETRKLTFTGKISLAADTEFANIILESASKGKGTAATIATNGYDLALKNIKVSDTLPKTAIGNITGKGKTKVSLQSEYLKITGNVTGISELEIGEDTEIGGNLKTSVLTIRNKEEKQGVIFQVSGSVNIDTIENYGKKQNVLRYNQNKSNTSNLTIHKKIHNHEESKLLLEQRVNCVSSNDYLKDITLSKKEMNVEIQTVKKLATLPKASGDSFEMAVINQTNPADSQKLSDDRIVKANKGVYYIDDTVMPYRTKLTAVSMDGEKNVTEISYCLDYHQAISEINQRAEKNTEYYISFSSVESSFDKIIDTNITDKNFYSSFSLPKKDMKHSLTIEGDEKQNSRLLFTGAISGYGKIKFKNLILNPVKGGNNEEAADVKISILADKTDSEWIFQNVTIMKETRNDNGGKGAISAINGVKNKTRITLKDCEKLIVKSGISNVQKLILSQTGILAGGNSSVQVIRLEDSAYLDIVGKLTVTDVEVSDFTNTSYIGAVQTESDLPALVVNGNVTEGILLVKAYKVGTGVQDAETIWNNVDFKETDRNALEVEDYTKVALVEVKNADVEKIRAYPFRLLDKNGNIASNPEGITKDNFMSYKEGKYIKNGTQKDRYLASNVVAMSSKMRTKLETDANMELEKLSRDKNMYALVYLTDSYPVKELPDKNAETVLLLGSGHTVQIMGVKVQWIYQEEWEEEIPVVWYRVQFYDDEKMYFGYIEEEYLAYSDELLLQWKEQFGDLFPLEIVTYGVEIDFSDVEQFPASYQTQLKKLKESYPEWIFVPMNVTHKGVKRNWEDCVTEQLGDYSWISSNQPEIYREEKINDSWYYASREGIAYYMDPRNFLTANDIFQFELNSYNETYHTAEAVQLFLNHTFMEGKVPGDPDGYTYAQVIWNSGKSRKLSPFVLAARVIQEQGIKGTSAMISGTYAGFEGYYNYYNIGATGKTDAEVLNNGLSYAKSKGWDTRTKALDEGADTLSSGYISKGQDTLYLQKFDVEKSRGYLFQYMQNIMAAYTEGRSMRSMYQKSGVMGKAFVFKIPVFLNMPSQGEELKGISLNVKEADLYVYDESISFIPFLNEEGKTQYREATEYPSELHLEVGYEPEDTTENKNIIWTCSNSDIIEITVDEADSSKAKIIAKEDGTVMVTATSIIGGYTASAEINVHRPMTGAGVTKNQLTLYCGQAEQIPVTFVPYNTTDVTEPKWYSENPQVAYVKNGKIVAGQKGETILHAAVGPFDGTQRELTCTVTVKNHEVIFKNSDGTTWLEAEGEYGKELSELELPDTRNPWELEMPDKVFLGWYTQPDGKGEAIEQNSILYESITVYPYFIDNTAEFCVKPIGNLMYTGGYLKPQVRVYHQGELLVLDKDYTVSYENNKAVNSGEISSEVPKIIIKGKGAYYGKNVTETFSIVPKNLSQTDMNVKDLWTTYNGKVQKPIPVIEDYNRILQQDIDYTLEYFENGEGAYCEAGSYGVLISGKGNYTGSRIVYINISRKVLISQTDMEQIEDVFWQEGKESIPDVKLSYQGIPLKIDTDYSITCMNNKDTGLATVVIEGKGAYTGVREEEFRITGFDFSKVTISGIEDLEYSGEALQQKSIEVRDTSGQLLKQGTDYTITYQNNIRIGTAVVLLSGIGRFEGEKKVHFKVLPYDIQNNDQTYTYQDENGKEQSSPAFQIKELQQEVEYDKTGARPTVVVMFKDNEMKEGIDYTLTYENNEQLVTEENQAKVIITGKGNFTQSISKSFIILPKALAKVTVYVRDVVFRNKKGFCFIEPEFREANGRKLIKGTDYEEDLIYTYGSDVVLMDGTIRTAGEEVKQEDIPVQGVQKEAVIIVTAKGKGNYTGSYSTSYKILKQE